MKKLFLASALGLFVLASSAGIVGHHFVETHAEGVNVDLATLLTSYVSGEGTYTKKTAIYLTSEAAQVNKSYFHANSTRMKMTTYYDETAGALLMGNYDGGFSINSGYKNDGNGNASHFYYRGTSDPNTAELFTNISTDWTAKGQEVGNYYRTLSSLASYVSTSEDSTNTWTQSGSAFIHAIDRTNANAQGYYSDETLHNFMFFAAPLLLDKVTDNAFLNLSRIVVQPATNFLSIRIFTSKTDAGKLQLTGLSDADDMLFSEARVYRGLSFNPGPAYVVSGAYGSGAWETQANFAYAPDTNSPEQYEATLNVTSSDFYFKVTDGGSGWWGDNHLASGETWHYLNGNTGDGDDNINIVAVGTINIYWNPMTSTISASGENIKYRFTWDQDWVFNGDAVVFVQAWGGSAAGNDYIQVTKVSDTEGEAVLPNSLYDGCLLVRCAPGTTVPDWSATGDNVGRIYNKTADVYLSSNWRVFSFGVTFYDYSPA